MNKQSEAKAAQNYRKTANTCSNCAHYKSEIVEFNSSWYGKRTKETGIHCSLGGFAVLKTATCDRHILSEAEWEK